jgi:hypothetical protein
VYDITQAEFDAIPTGLPYLPNWSLVVNPAGTVAYVDGDTLHWVSADTYAWWQPLYGKPPIQVPDDVFNPHPGGEQFNPPRPPPPPSNPWCCRVFIYSLGRGSALAHSKTHDSRQAAEADLDFTIRHFEQQDFRVDRNRSGVSQGPC